jgi:hypothetical protein
MTIEHSALTGASLHEPKGVASATAGKCYVADGAGSGAWTLMNTRSVQVELTDVSTSSSAFVACPFAGTITKIHSVLHSAITVANSALTSYINGVAITNGNWTVAQSGSAAGDMDSATPSAANTVAIGDVLKVTTDGASTDAARLTITFTIKVS